MTSVLHYDYVMNQLDGPGQLGNIVQVITEATLQSPNGATADIAGFLHQKYDQPVSGALTMAAMVKYAYYGQQTFQIGPELQEMFKETSLGSIPQEAIRLPYPTFYLDLPDCPWEIWGGARTGWHKVAGAYVQLEQDTLLVVIWGRENAKSEQPGDDATVWFRMGLDQCFKTYGNIETYLEQLLSPENAKLAINDADGDMSLEVHQRQKDVYINVYRVAINLILYLQTEGVEADPMENTRLSALTKKIANAKNPGKKKKYQRQLTQISKATVVRIGKTLESKMASLRSTPGVKRAQWVRGHWHRYWVGKGRETLVPRWIHPYPKNLGAEEFVEKRLYEVTEPPT